MAVLRTPPHQPGYKYWRRAGLTHSLLCMSFYTLCHRGLEIVAKPPPGEGAGLPHGHNCLVSSLTLGRMVFTM